MRGSYTHMGTIHGYCGQPHEPPQVTAAKLTNHPKAQRTGTTSKWYLRSATLGGTLHSHGWSMPSLQLGRWPPHDVPHTTRVFWGTGFWSGILTVLSHVVGILGMVKSKESDPCQMMNSKLFFKSQQLYSLYLSLCLWLNTIFC